jgi:hypothetical protein
MATGKLAPIQPDFFRHALCSGHHRGDYFTFCVKFEAPGRGGW